VFASAFQFFPFHEAALLRRSECAPLFHAELMMNKNHDETSTRRPIHQCSNVSSDVGASAFLHLPHDGSSDRCFEHGLLSGPCIPILSTERGEPDFPLPDASIRQNVSTVRCCAASEHFFPVHSRPSWRKVCEGIQHRERAFRCPRTPIT
jgi:hypothetical protein